MLKRALAPAVAGAILLSLLVAAPPATAETVTAAQLPGLLRTAAPDTTHPYSRESFEHWTDADGDGCNTRYEVLIEESTTPVDVIAGCALSGGTWVSPYDGFATSDTAQIQIDHVVALAEAWRSGAWSWTPDQRRDFANDLDVPYALTAASGTSNQSKADKDPSSWMPPNSSYRCEYATSWALVKYRWSLSVDEAEAAALSSILNGECGATPIELPVVMSTNEGQAAPSFPPGVTRLYGASRYDTAVAASQRHEPGVPAVFVAAGSNFPDALSAASAAATLGGPLLLTPATALPDSVRLELERLRPERIYVVGSVHVVSDAVLNALRTLDPGVTRVGGADRYATGRAVVTAGFASADRAFIATGRGFADALAASGAAGSVAAPVVLVDGAQSTVPEATLALLAEKGVQHVTVAGGPGSVSQGIMTQLSQRGYTVERIGGADRYTTAQLINDRFFSAGAVGTSVLANGLNFPDALAGAALAGRIGGPLFITPPACVPEAEHLALLRFAPAATVVIGGPSVVSADAAQNLGCLRADTPRVSGTAVVGYTLTASPGTWSAGTSFAYQWLAAGAPIAGANGSSLPLSSSMAGKRISVRVTGSNPGYVSTAVTSATTATVGYPGSTKPVDTWTCPSWAPIKGNIASNGEKIYHLPGWRYYSQTNPEMCFRTETDAKAAGYRASKVQ
ncbi:DUF1524 domain-containing protein [Microbacterium bovistercoris]|uniref:DUF1524 domain-containing protein n=1 Tax=Microbacterium bovistercoris TaxID=2293570 RepID=A0A371NYW0_9MICO|nr:cell wall-binding repeat-containing protein [Microbacterium bovistercoris]REJ08934.1 DUF1524 domain-containing protein [Microbacterium bovistercoris]